MDLVILVAGVLAAASVAVLSGRAARRMGPAAPPDGVTARDRGSLSLREALRNTRSLLGARVAKVLQGGSGDVFGGIEEALVGADVGVATARTLVERLKTRVPVGSGPAAIQDALREVSLEVLSKNARTDSVPGSGTRVILVLGVNGVGKTTTIGKLAARFAAAGDRVLLVAADTFRAAAGDQLAAWARRVGADIVRNDQSPSPAAVVYDGLVAAVSRHCDVVLVDTAGRLHTRKPLVEELRKIRRVIGEVIPGAPHETLLVLDATTGQNAIAQARTFSEAVEITGVVLTKLDGTARGGVALALGYLLDLPIVEVGVGEAAGDLRPFDRDAFVAALLDPEGASA